MFTGIDEVDWASMQHAYGSAEDVPGILRALASPCPQERETALDGMYGAVHHQGDVYDSTLACIPFLLALVTHAELPDRSGIVELLVSIGGGDADDVQHDEDDLSLDAGEEDRANDNNDNNDNYAMARTAIRAGAAVFVELVADRDPEVRRAVPRALVRFLVEPARVLGLLRQRLDDEREGGVRLALAEGLGLFTRLHTESAGPAVDCLMALSAAPNDPGLRLAALGQLAGCAPDRLPADLVPTVVALLRARSQRPRVPAEPERPDTDTLIGHLRRLRPADEEGSQLLRTLHSALDDRTTDRIALLKGQLTSADPADRCNAVWMSAGLFREWRADYEEPVALIGEQLASDEERLRDAAVSVLESLFTLAVPAADRLAVLVEAAPESWGGGTTTLGRPLKALARSGDSRAVPALAQVLAQPVIPSDIGYTIECLGPAAEQLAPLLRERLGEVPLDSPDTYNRAAPLLSALGRLRYGAAVPEVLRLLHRMPRELRFRDSLVEALARTLGTFGTDAREAIPALRELLDGERAVAAATALWSVTGDVEAVLPPLLRELTAEEAGHPRMAAEALGRLGALAAPALPELRRLAESAEVWERTAAACALWDIDGDPETVLPVLRSAWRQNAYTRGTIAACLVRMGTAAAPAHDLVHAELAAPRRHRARRSGGYGSHDILEDERLLHTCRAALDAT
ncbi:MULTISPECIES: HEAT repeat domain-containing protein [unclassified Streptomyces]|uniref:HEAT repeat domain-containing protein n=1 Tax=unclassified Streptomyces TaxID=2593676 RepID=UPI002E80D57A|nr:HEAT repeat domain-containing protein [Streptomyces sp. NBC_00589]WTI41118.1 HEAT repeat domain-containing protein [Streptomyces sp. NBC_00775]WUB25198.1 HEAT repeat domain-containing protein [Streptomyces sp. NBC_00589]